MSTLTKISIEEYLNQEATPKHKNEYHGGEVRAMTGASESYNVITTNLMVD